MKNLTLLTYLLAVIVFSSCTPQDPHSFYVNRNVVRTGSGLEHTHKRYVRQTRNSADQMVQNILQWIQSVYNQNNRKIRQNSLREYLPPSLTEKPRPFQPVTQLPVGNQFTGYPLPGSSPQPPFTDYTRPPPIYTTPEQPSGPTTGYPSERPEENGIYPGYPSGPQTGYPSGPSTGYPSGPQTGYPSGPQTGYPTPGYETTQPPQTIPTRPPYTPDENIYPTRPDSDGNESEGAGSIQTSPPTSFEPDDDDKHPPHIHAIDVECAKDMMTINIEFNKVYNGIIYSKGYYNQPECRYVSENSNQLKYSFTVNLNSCGTQFINAFDTQGQSYLENVLVLQNEASIQEVWDTIRSVRCLWEGNLNKALSVSLSVGMLNQEIVTFSGDTAMAKLDIQLGKGPFAPNANGLVKIGETMTLVVSVTGDPGFDIQVRDCHARDSNSQNSIALTDKNGCVLKPKLFGAFQKTRNTGNTGASIIAYAFFNAFKFPDVMDLILECNVELCKTDCEVCPDPNQKLEPGRKKRDLTSINNFNNESLIISDPVMVGKILKVFVPEDIIDENHIISLGSSYNEGVCLSKEGFLFSAVIIVSLLVASCSFSMYIWIKSQRLQNKF